MITPLSSYPVQSYPIQGYPGVTPGAPTSSMAPNPVMVPRNAMVQPTAFQPPTPPWPSPGAWMPQRPLPQSVTPSTSPNTRVRIVYNNDPHKQIWAMPEVIEGFHRAVVDGLQKGQDVLTLNGGDNYIGQKTEDLMAQLGLQNLQFLTAAALGNHDLDVGTVEFAKGVMNANLNSPLVVCNLNIPPNTAMDYLVKAGKISTHPLVVQAPQGQYGIVGVTTPNLFSVINPDTTVEGVTPMTFEQTKAVVQQQIDALAQQGINKVMVVSHMGLELDQKLAQQVSGIDVIVGGHTHDTLRGVVPGKNWFSGPKGEPVLILQAGKNAKYLGYVDLLFDPAGRVTPLQNQILKSEDFPKNVEAEQLLHKFYGPPKPVANVTTYYNNENNPFVPDPVAQFTADTLYKMSNADIAMVRSAELRRDIKPGVLTDQDVKVLFPFNDHVVRFKASGDAIIKSLLRSAHGLHIHDSHPGMVHPAGLRFSVYEKDEKIGTVEVKNRATGQWEPIDPNKLYTVAMGEYAAKNGEEWPEIHKEAEHTIDWRGGLPLRDVFLYGLKQANALQKPIAFIDDGRVKFFP